MERLIAAWGEPDSSVALGSGGQRHTWTRWVGSTQVGSTYLGADGKVTKHPDLVTSKLVVIQATVSAEGLVKEFQAAKSR